MAGSSSGKAAYWTGALTGLIFSIGLVAVLSVLGHKSGDSAEREVANATESTAPQSAAETATPEPVEPSPAPATEQVVAATPEPAPEALPEPTQQPEPEPAPAAQPEPEPEPIEQAVLAPAPQPQPEVEEDAAPADSSGEEPAIIGGGGALVDHSEFFNGDPGEPVLAIVLVEVGSAGQTDEVFLLPAPLTVAIDPSAESASDLVLDARDSGFEALAALSNALPDAEGDAAETVTAGLADMEGVIGVVTLDGSLVGNASINGVLTAIAPRGMALLDATEEGGSVAFRTAKGLGLPAAPLGRLFDETPSSAMVFQSLERAAFDARRTGAFVVIGKAEPSVLTGLRRWLNVKAGKSVAVAPLSEVVRRLRN